MLNPLKFISKFIKSSNQRELDKISKIVSKINSLEVNAQKLQDTDFPKKTLEFKEKIKNGKTLNQILPEAFALVREASKRVRNERHCARAPAGERGVCTYTHFVCKTNLVNQ